MNHIFTLTQQYIEQYDLDNHPWFIFAKKCTQSEFLKSQEGFYYAVKSFPRILAKLASQIDSSEARLLVIENLWEEHGHGSNKAFHTATYFQYLQSLGIHKEQSDISHQPWVEEWIHTVFHKDYTAAQYAMYIAGIEYIYARISCFISQLVSTYNLQGDQTHYANHSVLDYEHSKELIETSLLIQKEDGSLSHQDMMNYFSLGVTEFLQMYQHMTFLTESEALEISQEKHAFYYGREDTSINKKFLNAWYEFNSTPAQILMVCSGGENAIELLAMNEKNDITLLDINSHQLKLAEDKIDSIKTYGTLSDNLIQFTTGKFEKIFTSLKNSLTEDELKDVYYNSPSALAKLKWICDITFSNRILEIVFTENATKYSKDNFADHFFNVFKNQITWYFQNKPNYSNIGSILFDTPPINYNVSINKNSNIGYYNGDFLSFFNSLDSNIGFDLIDLSNISDWMPFEDIQTIVATSFERLNNNGVIVGRKLLGDYKWHDIQKDLDNSALIPLIDNTSFYTECVFIKKVWD